MHVKPSDFEAGRVIVFRENDFPYNLDEGIKHYLLWSNQDLSPLDIEECIKEHTAGAIETLWFINPVQLKSIPELWHAHVMVLWA